MPYPVIEHISTGEKNRVILFATNMFMEWYAFENKNGILEGYVQNNIDPECSEFGSFTIADIRSVCSDRMICGNPDTLSKHILPPTGFRFINKNN